MVREMLGNPVDADTIRAFCFRVASDVRDFMLGRVGDFGRSPNGSVPALEGTSSPYTAMSTSGQGAVLDRMDTTTHPSPGPKGTEPPPSPGPRDEAGAADEGNRPGARQLASALICFLSMSLVSLSHLVFLLREYLLVGSLSHRGE